LRGENKIISEKWVQVLQAAKKESTEATDGFFFLLLKKNNLISHKSYWTARERFI
jgi:hypothetical protein